MRTLRGEGEFFGKYRETGRTSASGCGRRTYAVCRIKFTRNCHSLLARNAPKTPVFGGNRPARRAVLASNMCRFATRYRPFRIAKRYISQDNGAKTARKTEEKRFVKFIRAVFAVLNIRAGIVKKYNFSRESKGWWGGVAMLRWAWEPERKRVAAYGGGAVCKSKTWPAVGLSPDFKPFIQATLPLTGKGRESGGSTAL